ncbi:CHAD domain-containing protein [Xanthobacteraceae bacterium Astr-EGSB]|uniref:CHAD domain-containing protein n=1 Tax=Astrobacterium formosum TaxID=3069710 RepID=UPI0027B3E4D6|nr:CHAD domain-containing protein [Xanthobacteraceae bacterium Astr-EGSB]
MTTEHDTLGLATGAEVLRGMPEDVLGKAIEALGDPNLPDAAVVHDFRKAMKRWRAMLRLLEPFLGEGGVALHDEARHLARTLAGARDVRAALDALADLPADASLSERSRTTIRARLEHLSASAETDSIAAASRERLKSALSYAAQAAQRWPLERIGFSDIADELARSYRRTRDAIPDDWFSADAAELHELRKRVVAHRHQMELVVPLWPRFGKLWVNEAQRLRDRLGQYQDLDVLTRLSGAHQPLAPWRSRLVPLIAARQRDHVIASARLAGRLFAEKPRAFRRRLLALWEHRTEPTEAAEAPLPDDSAADQA